MHYIILTALALIGMIVHLFLEKGRRSPKRIVEIALLYLLFFFVGIGSFIGFLGHAFIPDKIAHYIGWPAGHRFQFEVAVANLSVAALGILCLWLRGNFWTATIIAATVFGWGAAFGHIRQMAITQNYAPGNAGLVFYVDIILPLILIILLVTYKIKMR